VTDEWLRRASRPVRMTRIDATAPNVARVWNYMTGGQDNFEADRSAARELLAAAPVMADVAPASRAFLRRVVTFLAAEAGIRQFLDIGTGIPTAGSTHELAQAVDPASRVVYVDNDPVVLAHARALLYSRPEGAVSYLDADARVPAAIIAAAGRTLDLSQPAAVVMIGVLTFIEGPGLAAAVLRALVGALCPGSYLAIMQAAADERLLAAQRRWNELGRLPAWLRDRAEVASWFTGLSLVEPGIVEVHEWRPDGDDPAPLHGMPLYGAVARKP
jgi:S-adenosyl methyltransferase